MSLQSELEEKVAELYEDYFKDEETEKELSELKEILEKISHPGEMQ